MKKCYSCAHNLSCAQQDCPMDRDGAITFPKWEPSIAYLDGRRAGIEEAAKALGTRALAIGTSLLHAGFYATSAEFVRALLEGK